MAERDIIRLRELVASGAGDELHAAVLSATDKARAKVGAERALGHFTEAHLNALRTEALADVQREIDGYHERIAAEAQASMEAARKAYDPATFTADETAARAFDLGAWRDRISAARDDELARLAHEYADLRGTADAPTSERAAALAVELRRRDVSGADELTYAYPLTSSPWEHDAAYLKAQTVYSEHTSMIGSPIIGLDDDSSPGATTMLTVTDLMTE